MRAPTGVYRASETKTTHESRFGFELKIYINDVARRETIIIVRLPSALNRPYYSTSFTPTHDNTERTWSSFVLHSAFIDSIGFVHNFLVLLATLTTRTHTSRARYEILYNIVLYYILSTLVIVSLKRRSE